jgi:hypothetical protein
MSRRTSLQIRLLVVALPGLLSGCGGPPAAGYGDLVAAHGRVTLDGEPLAGAVVTFTGDDGQFAYGLTDESGRYALQVDSATKGVTPGRKTVRVSTTARVLGLNSDEEGGAESTERGGKKRAKRDRVPARYHADSDLTVLVTLDRSTYDFDLMSE